MVKDSSFIGNYAIGIGILSSENVTIDGALVGDNKPRIYNV
jgi:hypothetical protein